MLDCCRKIMNKVWCFVCQNVFDAQKGHHCWHSQPIPKSFQSKNAQLLTKEQENYCESQLIFSVTDKQSSYPTSVINEFENANLDVSAQTNIKVLQTNSDFQLSQTSECLSQKMKQKSMVCFSVQTSVQESAKRETDVQAKSLNNPVSIIDYNFPLDLSTRNSREIVKNCGTSNIKTQFSNIEVSSMSNSENNNPELTMASMNIDSLMLNKKGPEFSLKGHQQRSNVKIDQLLTKNSQDHSKEKNLFSIFNSKIFAPYNEIVPKEYRKLSKMNHQSSVSRQIVHDSVQKHDIENTSDPATIKTYSTNQQLNSNNTPTVDETTDCTVTASRISHETDLTFGNQIYQGVQKQNEPEEILNPYTKESIQHCSADAIASDIRPCRSLDSELPCPTFLKEFRTKNDLKQRYQIHCGERSFSCNICQKAFTQKSILNWHRWKIHYKDEKPHKCEICGNIFSRKYVLERHIQTHMCDKQYKCDICGKLFTRKDGLITHNRTHTGEKPYKCDICRRAFPQKSNLNRHVKGYHKGT